ncbi:GNAT family N-acetyltransferase [Plantactinospora sp. WMMB334]|uniref:GNAT family N-acetyltransferase n=1 Tax=Plantactinospora sp. WMMB334 TaxID=3404119 RepID=UPI003B95C023
MRRHPDLRRSLRLRHGQTFAWRPAAPVDAAMIWTWWTRPDLTYWGTAPRLGRIGPPPYDAGTVRQYLELPPERLGVTPLVGALDGTPVAYAETYAKGDSPLASVPVIEDSARGSHLLVDPVARVDRRIVFEIVVDGVDWSFETWPEADHYIGDPDVRNRSMLHLHSMLGMRQVAVVELPHKTASLVAISRADWSARREQLAAVIRR